MVGTADPELLSGDDNGQSSNISHNISSSGDIDGRDRPSSSRQPHHQNHHHHHHHQLGHGIVDPIMEDSMSHFSHGSLDGDPTQDGTSNNSDEDKNTAAFQKGDDLARIESKAILWLRFVVLTLLFLTALVVGIVVFFVSKNSEVKDFETQFETRAKQALESIQTNVATKLGAMESLAVGLTSQFGTIPSTAASTTTKARNGTWPFVTIPDFTNRVAPTLALTNALSVGIIPLVTPSLRQRWEQYSVTKGPAWIATDQQAYRDNQEQGRRRRHHHQRRRRTTRHTQSTRQMTDESMRLRRRIPHQLGRTSDSNHTIQENQQPQQQATATATTTTRTITTRHRSLLSETTPGPIPDFSNGFSSRLYRVEEFPDPTTTSTNDVPPPPPLRLRQVEPTVYDSNSAPPYYLPIWQHSHVVPGLVNYNLQSSFHYFGPGANACVTSQKSVLSMVAMERVGPLGEAIQNVWEPEDRLEDDDNNERQQQQHRPHHYGDPWSVLYFPIFDRFEHFNDSDADEESSGGGGGGAADAEMDSPRTLVGMVQVISYWSTYLDHVTNDDKAKGLMIVLQSVACQQTYTYRMDGPEVTFVGEGDLHDTTYNDLFYEMTNGFEALGERGGGRGSGSSGSSLLTPLNFDFCPLSVRIYPSASTRDSYTSRKPGLYTMGVVFVFLFALVIFLCYDCIVERRQRKVLKTAVENRAIVASLFPEAIRDRLFNHANNESAANQEEQKTGVHATIQGSGLLGGGATSRGSGSGGGGGGIFDGNVPTLASLKESAPLQLKNYLMSGFGGDYTSNGGMSSKMEDNKPIADLFPESTVMFGDISGFTAWSSQREPIQVFTLLQTLYQAFDKLAKRFRVFKVLCFFVAVTLLACVCWTIPMRGCFLLSRDSIRLSSP
jgi:hypothetical protein